MSLIQKLEMKDSAFQPYLNTGTLIDVQTGCFVPGDHNGMILNGGLSTTNAIVGRSQMFKSTVLFSLLMKTLGIYSHSECFVYDTEYAQKKERLMCFSSFTNQGEFNKRLVLNTPQDITAEEYLTIIKNLCTEKTSKPKDYLVESPILDPRTGKPLLMWIPTFVVYDSWSKMRSSYVQTTLDTKEVGSSDTNMIFMKDGAVKKLIMSQIPRLATMAGVYFVTSAHVGQKAELDPRTHTPKTLQHMRHTDSLKEVGSDFNFLMSNAMEMRKVDDLTDPDHKCLYPISNGGDAELHEVTSLLLRCKNGMSGTSLPMVVSQTRGILTDLTNYHYLRKNDYFGLNGSKQSHKITLTDIEIDRKTARKHISDPNITRALDIIAQLCYIRKNWDISNIRDVDFSMTPLKLAEKLLGSDGPTVSDILQSRGYWTYDKTNVQPYLSLYDILSIAQGHYRSKGISLSGVPSQNQPTPSPETPKKKS